MPQSIHSSSRFWFEKKISCIAIVIWFIPWGGDFISHNLNRASNKIIFNKNHISGKMKLLLHTVNVRDCESLGTSDLVQVRGPSRRWKISESPGDWIVPLGCPVRPGNKAVQVELGEGSPWLITTMKKGEIRIII